MDILSLLEINSHEEKRKLTESGWKNYLFELRKEGLCHTSPFSLFKTKFQSRFSVQILKYKLIIEKEINCQISNFLIKTKLFSLGVFFGLLHCIWTFFFTFSASCHWSRYYAATFFLLEGESGRNSGWKK